jgi:hypothetical protein
VKSAALRTAQIAGGLALAAVVLSLSIGMIQKRRLVNALARRKREYQSSASDASMEKTSIVPFAGGMMPNKD